MCGIAGIVSMCQNSVDRQEAERMSEAMRNRGPDGQGTFADAQGRVALVHRRLAIIDLDDRSAQPMCTPDERFWITFNGEIYNYRELREELLAQGAPLRTTSDTEVLLELYARHQSAMLDRLQGMFAFAIWDAERRELFAARDPHGIKPFYYAVEGGLLRFASSVRALLAARTLSREIDAAGVAGFLAWGSVPEPRTVFRSIRALPAGCHLRADSSRCDPPQRYWDLSGIYARGHAPARGDDGDIRGVLLNSVRKHFVADVPVGLFLSGGIDSGTLLGLATEALERPVDTVTLAFSEFRGTSEDEAPSAEATAKRYGAAHQTVWLDRSRVERDILPFIGAMDQPTVDGLNTYWVSAALRQTGIKTAVSGIGGDELFGGYPSFRRFVALRRAAAVAASVPARALILMATRRLAVSRRRSKYAYLADALTTQAGTYHLLRGVFTPNEIARLMAGDAWVDAVRDDAILGPVRGGWGARPANDWSRIAVAEQTMYMRNQLLRDADWAAMAHGVEIRLPLVDRQVTEAIGPIVAASRGRGGKEPLWRSARPPLPRAAVHRPKTGFGLPMRLWTQRFLERGALSLPPTSLVSPIDPRSLAREVEAGHVHWSRPWALLVLGSYLGSLP